MKAGSSSTARPSAEMRTLPASRSRCCRPKSDAARRARASGSSSSIARWGVDRAVLQDAPDRPSFGRRRRGPRAAPGLPVLDDADDARVVDVPQAVDHGEEVPAEAVVGAHGRVEHRQRERGVDSGAPNAERRAETRAHTVIGDEVVAGRQGRDAGVRGAHRCQRVESKPSELPLSRRSYPSRSSRRRNRRHHRRRAPGRVQSRGRHGRGCRGGRGRVLFGCDRPRARLWQARAAVAPRAAREAVAREASVAIRTGSGLLVELLDRRAGRPRQALGSGPESNSAATPNGSAKHSATRAAAASRVDRHAVQFAGQRVGAVAPGPETAVDALGRAAAADDDLRVLSDRSGAGHTDDEPRPCAVAAEQPRRAGRRPTCLRWPPSATGDSSCPGRSRRRARPRGAVTVMRVNRAPRRVSRPWIRHARERAQGWAGAVVVRCGSLGLVGRAGAGGSDVKGAPVDAAGTGSGSGVVGDGSPVGTGPGVGSGSGVGPGSVAGSPVMVTGVDAAKPPSASVARTRATSSPAGRERQRGHGAEPVVEQAVPVEVPRVTSAWCPPGRWLRRAAPGSGRPWAWRVSP